MRFQAAHFIDTIMKKLFLPIIVVMLFGCNNLTPAGFWKSFDSDHIIKSNSDQGPWGGHRTITWKNQAGIYNSGDIIRFAESKGWRLSHTIIIDTLADKNVSIKNTGNKAPEDADLAINGGNTEGNLIFSGCVNRSCTLYEFDSGWTRVDEGETITAQGYILINASKTRMTMFHSWGE
jgi:hypothetical protein